MVILPFLRWVLESSNEAAAAFSEAVGDARFVSLMNRKAESFGMHNTQFADASGADAGNISTAEDLFALAKNMYDNRSVILKISAGNLKDATYTPPSFKDLANFNEFAGDPEFVGGKTGETLAARQTILSIFELNLGGVKRPVAIIALGSDDRVADVRVIRDYIKANYRELLGKGDAAASLP